MIISNLLAKPQEGTAVRATLATEKAVIITLVAHTGFDPVIASLGGGGPKPLDECATSHKITQP